MALLRLIEDHVKYIANLPESGMGYQLADLPVDEHGRGLYFIINSVLLIRVESQAQLLQELAELREVDPEELESDGRLDAVHLATPPRNDRGSFKTISSHDPTIQASLFEPSLHRTSHIMRNQPLVSASSSAGRKAYFRFSAFRNDRRVEPDGSFKKGTYATTLSDYSMVPNGYSAVGRYALPNPMPACFVFPLVTDSSPIYVGTAVPNFGQAGGGVEVLFTKKAQSLHGRPWEITQS